VFFYLRLRLDLDLDLEPLVFLDDLLPLALAVSTSASLLDALGALVDLVDLDDLLPLALLLLVLLFNFRSEFCFWIPSLEEEGISCPWMMAKRRVRKEATV